MSKEEAKKILKGIEIVGGSLPEDGDLVEEALLMAIQALEKPSVTDFAEWVDDKCSSCGKGIEDLITSSEWYWNENPKYCPFCGAKMVKPQKSEE